MSRSCDTPAEKNKANLILDEAQRSVTGKKHNALILLRFQSVRHPLHHDTPFAQHALHQTQFKGKPADKARTTGHLEIG